MCICARATSLQHAICCSSSTLRNELMNNIQAILMALFMKIHWNLTKIHCTNFCCCCCCGDVLAHQFVCVLRIYERLCQIYKVQINQASESSAKERAHSIDQHLFSTLKIYTAEWLLIRDFQIENDFLTVPIYFDLLWICTICAAIFFALCACKLLQFLCVFFSFRFFFRLFFPTISVSFFVSIQLIAKHIILNIIIYWRQILAIWCLYRI